jgi:hypothetical protein
MTDDTARAENAGRGTALSALSVPVGMALFAIVAGIFSVVESYLVLLAGVAAYVVPFAAAWFYRVGAGAEPRVGRLPFIAVSVIAIVVSVFTGIVVSTLAAFTRVGGDGGILSPVFWTALRNQFDDLEVVGIPALVGLSFGVFGLMSVLRGRSLRGRKPPARHVETDPGADSQA